MKKLLLTIAFVLVNYVIAIVMAKLLNTPVEIIVAYVALGICCGMQADWILDKLNNVK